MIVTTKGFFKSKNDNFDILKFKTQILEKKALPEAIIKIYRLINF